MREPTEMELVVGVNGGVRCIYDEALDLQELWKLQITRASHAEPDSDGICRVDLGPPGGPVLWPFGAGWGVVGVEEERYACLDIDRQCPENKPPRPRIGNPAGSSSSSACSKMCWGKYNRGTIVLQPLFRALVWSPSKRTNAGSGRPKQSRRKLTETREMPGN